MGWLACVLVIAAGVVVPVRTLVTPMSRAAIERALALARWPATDADRARFHEQYVARVATATDPTRAVAVDTIEVVTEFRRMELIAEAHARLNDLFARGGAIQEAEQALQPYRGRLSVIAHVRFALASPSLPDVAVVFADPAPRPISESPVPFYTEGVITGIDAEAVFAAAGVGETTRTVVVLVDRRPIARAAFDFRTLQ